MQKGMNEYAYLFLLLSPSLQLGQVQATRLSLGFPLALSTTGFSGSAESVPPFCTALGGGGGASFGPISRARTVTAG